MTLSHDVGLRFYSALAVGATEAVVCSFILVASTTLDYNIPLLSSLSPMIQWALAKKSLEDTIYNSLKSLKFTQLISHCTDVHLHHIFCPCGKVVHT